MPSDYYAEDEDQETGPTGGSADEGVDKPDDESNETGNEGFLVPKSALSGDVNVGDKVVCKVVRVYEDEIELAMTGPEESDEGEDQPAMKERMDAMGEMAMPSRPA